MRSDKWSDIQWEVISEVISNEKAAIRLLEFRSCLLMFWLHTVVLSKTRTFWFTCKQSKLVRLHCLFCGDILQSRHISTAIYRFHEINSSRQNYIMTFLNQVNTATSYQGRSRIRLLIPMFIVYKIYTISLQWYRD